MIELIDNDQLITDFKNKKVKKQNKCMAKRNMRLDNLRALMRALTAGFATLFSSYCIYVFYSRSFTSLLSCFVPILLSRFILALLFLICTSANRFFTCLLPLFFLVSCFKTFISLLFCSVPILVLRFLSILLLLFMLSLAFSYLVSLVFKTF